MIKLSPRLQAILNSMPNISCANIADVGCDHGKLIVEAIIQGKSKKGYALDISKPSLLKAEELASNCGLNNEIEFLVSDGLMGVQGVMDCTFIAGMGGEEIKKIVKRDYKKSKYFIISPNNNELLVRWFLKDMDFHIEKDFYVKDDFFYPVIVFSTINGKNNYLEDELFIGKNEPKQECYMERNMFRFGILENIKKNAKDKMNVNLIKEYEVLDKWLKLNK